MRLHLRWIVMAWMLCQAGAMAAAPLVLNATAAMDGDHVVCTCPGALPGQACPMHHPEEASRRTGGFLLQNPCAPSPAAMLFLAGGVGLPAAVRVTIGLAPAADRVAAAPHRFVTYTTIPESPPPRA